MSLMGDVTHQVKHPPTCTIHSPFTGGLYIFFFTQARPNNIPLLLTGAIVSYKFQVVMILSTGNRKR